jgi:hypothetical protein
MFERVRASLVRHGRNHRGATQLRKEIPPIELHVASPSTAVIVPQLA